MSTHISASAAAIKVSDDLLTDEELEYIVRDPNCQRSLMGKTLDDLDATNIRWLKLTRDGAWAGAFLLEVNLDDSVCMHICSLEHALSRNDSIIATQLAVKIAMLRGLVPYTTVSRDPRYDYMRKFLEDCGYEKHSMQSAEIDVYKVPDSQYYTEEI